MCFLIGARADGGEPPEERRPEGAAESFARTVVVRGRRGHLSHARAAVAHGAGWQRCTEKGGSDTWRRAAAVPLRRESRDT
jgi:hypothetical protein